MQCNTFILSNDVSAPSTQPPSLSFPSLTNQPASDVPQVFKLLRQRIPILLSTQPLLCEMLCLGRDACVLLQPLDAELEEVHNGADVAPQALTVGLDEVLH